MRRAILPMVLVLAACQSKDTGGATRDAAAQQASAGETPAPPSTAAAEAAAPLPALDVEGLRLVLDSGATRLLAFGTPRAQAEEAVGRAFDHPPERTRNEECGAGPMDFTAYGPLQLNFQDGGFVGWFLDGAGPSAIDGIGIGSTRAQVRSSRTLTMIPDSTLGEEFALGELTEESIGGFFDGPGAQAKVTQLFAGINCFFR